MKPQRPQRKFVIGQDVESDIYGVMRIVAYWWTDKPYGSKDGSWVYRLAFLTKSKEIDKRKNFRQFEENRLTPLKQLES